MAKLDSRFTNLIATDEEASAGLLNNKAITPKQLSTLGGTSSPATTEAAGIIGIATHVEAVAGTNSTVAIAPSEMLPIMWDLTAKWTERTLPMPNDYHTICWAPELKLFCLTASSNGNTLLTSPDGITWTERTLPSSLQGCHNICWAPELKMFYIIGGGYNNNIAASSLDGINWTRRTLPSLQYWHGLCWSPELKMFCTATNVSILATYELS